MQGGEVSSLEASDLLALCRSIDNWHWKAVFGITYRLILSYLHTYAQERAVAPKSKWITPCSEVEVKTTTTGICLRESTIVWHCLT